MSDFKFDINAKKVRILDKDLIESLKKYAESNSNEYFSNIKYDKWEGKIASASTIKRRFGSWNKALEIIGIGKRVEIPSKDLIESLKKYARLKNNQPFSPIEYNKWGGKTGHSRTIRKRFGSWNKALQKIGVGGGHERQYTSEELIKNLETVWKELGYPPSLSQIHKYGNKITQGPYRRIWGSLNSACKQLALFHEGKLTREALLFGANTTNGCYVYLMLDTTNNHYKIGISNSPEYREKTLQSEKPQIQRIAYKKFINRAKALSVEKTLHFKYDSKRKRGEWFQLEPKEVDEIKIKLK